MSRLMWMDELIGGTTNLAQAILYTPTGRAQTNVKAELDKINSDLTELASELIELGTINVVGTLSFDRQGCTKFFGAKYQDGGVFVYPLLSNGSKNIVWATDGSSMNFTSYLRADGITLAIADDKINVTRSVIATRGWSSATNTTIFGCR